MRYLSREPKRHAADFNDCRRTANAPVRFGHPRPMKRHLLPLLLLLAICVSETRAVTVTLVTANDTWRFAKGLTEASTPIDAWRSNTFNDVAFSNAPAPFWYGDVLVGGTQLTDMQNGYLCIFLRKQFVITNIAEITSMELGAAVDDGFVAWINGQEVLRVNAPPEPFTINSAVATAAVEPPPFNTYAVTNFALFLSPTGTNVLTIQVFNAGIASTDLGFSASLSAATDDAPLVASTFPTPGSTVQGLTFVTVTFNENVSGVTVGDLLVNGSATATSILTNNPAEYQFNFPQPPTGSVTLAWAPGHGIADVDGSPNAFVPAGSWSYTLDTNLIAGSVIISEFMADNGNGISDEDGTRSDWIELHNTGLVDVNLQGWFLTETPLNLSRWRFPSVILQANKRLIVWASEKNRTNPAAPLHTNFKLTKSEGGVLALVNAQTNVVSAFLSYLPQVENISFGRAEGLPTSAGYFATPTPGEVNVANGSGFAAAPGMSLASGVYTNASLSLVITVPPGTTVRYTTDGTVPTTSSTAYSGPIALANNITIKARAFPTAGTLLPSDVVVRNFVFLDASTRNFNSNLPILILSTEGRGMASSVAPGQPRTRGTFMVFDTFRGRSALTGKPDLISPAEFEVFGQTSAGFPKQPYNIEIQDALGYDDAKSVLGLPSEADWKLRNPYADKCLMNDFLAYEIFDQMGNYSCRRRFVEVFVDTGGGRLSYPGDYVGVEVFLEKIERGKDRVDIKELTAYHTNGVDVTGGYMFKKDKDSGGDLNFTAGGQGLKLHEPKPNSMRVSQGVTTTWPGSGYTPSASNQMTYLVNYLNAFSTAMNAGDWLTRTGTNHYSHYIDVDAFVDQHWIVEFPKQIDGYRISNFYHKDRGGKVKPVPIWDWNLAFGNANYLDGGHTSAWYYVVLNDANAHIWLSRLVGNQPIPGGTAGDPDFIQKIIDRWGVLRTNVMNGDRLVARIDELGNLLAEAAGRNYGDKYTTLLNNYTWPNPIEGQGWDVDYTQPTYAGIISEMKKWTAGRYAWVDAQFPKQPQSSLPDGSIAGGSSLSLTAPAGTIYYTLDGRDPRASQANGAVAAAALTYASPVTLSTNARLFARARVGSVWSPPTISTFVVSTPQLVISEIMYHPAAPVPGPGVTNVDEDFEYLEVLNTGASTLSLGGYSISGGVDFTFPAGSLAANDRLLVVKNRHAFTNRYGTALNAQIAGEFSGNLANDGNRLILKGSLQEPILDFSYDDDWYPITDGFGFSLVIVDANAARETWGLQTSWRPSGALQGTPGTGDGAAPSFPQVVINEALTHSDPPPPTDTVELLNLAGAPADISGWYLTDDFGTPKKFRIPDGTILGAGGFVTFDESQFNTPSNAPTSFALSSQGDSIYLFSADLAGNLTGYHHGFDFGAARNGVTFGRYLNSQGAEHFVAESLPTLGSTNSGPLVGPIVISEIHYHPVDVFTNGAYWDNMEEEFIELHNITGGTVPLYDPAHPANTWRLRDAVSFDFPTNLSIGAGEYLIVANINSADPAALAAFRARYSLSPSVPVVGPYSGKLDNDSGKIELYRPDSPEPTGVPYTLVERIHYRDAAPWDAAADGIGAALQRIVVSAYGNDPTNWVAGGTSPGAPRGSA